MNPLESELTRLPEPTLPEGLAADITTRVTRLHEQRVADASEPTRHTAAAARRDLLAWALALLGVTFSLGAHAYRLIVGEATLDLTSLRISGGLQGAVEVLPATPAVAVLAAGLLLCLAGLFAPLIGAGPDS